METIYKLKPYEVSEEFLRDLFQTCRDKAITITVEHPQDETAYLLDNEVNRKILLERIEAAKQGKFVHTMTLEELEAMAK
jgi:hypothetical protein